MNGNRDGGSAAGRFAKAAAPLLAAGAALAVAAIALRRVRADHPPGEATYPPLDTPKPLADALWIVDSGPVRPAGLALPVRMTIVRLSNGDVLLHSPTRFTPALAQAIAALGPVRHLVAPGIAHWIYLAEWQRACPDAIVWAVPGLADRPHVRRSDLRIDRTLGAEAPAEWAGDLVQGIVAGGAGFREAYLFHRRSRTLILADLIQNLEPERLSGASRAVMRSLGAMRASTPRHVRAVLRLNGAEARAAMRSMLALSPNRVLFAHGRPFDADGARRLREAFAWADA